MNLEIAEPLLILAIALASAICGYLFCSRCEQDIYDRGYKAGLHRYHSNSSPTPKH